MKKNYILNLDFLIKIKVKLKITYNRKYRELNIRFYFIRKTGYSQIG